MKEIAMFRPLKAVAALAATLLLCGVALAQEAPATKAAKRDYTDRILTPKPLATPRVNGPNIYGQRPGRPFLYTIPATGDRPMKFAADNLPEGLRVDEKTGRITGKVDKAGRYEVTLRATNDKGSAEKKFRIVIGDALALTPPMGWNSWNSWAKD